MYRLYIGLVEIFGKGMGTFYFKPNANKFSFDKCPVGINSLNQILPDMYKAAGLRHKTTHCLRVTCASSLFNARVDSKLIRDRTGHRSDVLLKHEKAEKKVISHVSAILGPNPYTGKVDSDQETVVIKKKKMNCNLENKSSSFLSFGASITAM